MKICNFHFFHPNSPKHVALWPIITFFFFYCPVKAQAATSDTAFNFSSFSPDMPEISLEGDARVTEPIIDLTVDLIDINSSSGSVGRATYSEPVHLWDKGSGLLADFITHFSFVIKSSNGTNTTKGNGFAFFLAPNGSHLPANSGGAYLGLNSSTNVQDKYVAVEFDTAKSGWDPTNVQEHLGIDLNSLNSVVTVPWTLNDIANGGTIDASVRYDSTQKNLSVFVTNGDYRSPTNVDWYSLYTVVDLRDLLPEWVTLGFTASTTTSYFEKHQIHSWNFVSSLENPEIIANQTTPDRNQTSSQQTNQTSIPPTSPGSQQTDQTSIPPTSPDTDQIDIPPTSSPPPLPEKKKNKVSVVVIVLAIGFVALVLLFGLLCYCCCLKRRKQREPLPMFEKSSQKSALKTDRLPRDDGLEEESSAQSLGHEKNRTPGDEGFVEQSNLDSVPADVEGFVENGIVMSVITHGNNSLPTEKGSEEIRSRSPADESKTLEGFEEISIAQTVSHESGDTPPQEGFEDEMSSKTSGKSESNRLPTDAAIEENNSRPVEEGSAVKCSPRSFSYQELADATHNFSADHFLGEGGFGSVYRGELPDGNSKIVVAVKQMAPDLGHSRRRQAYEAEVQAISKLRHDHLVRLIGWCQENDKFLIVYEFMENGDLETRLFDKNHLLNWKQRYEIALGLASALSHMHAGPNEDYVIHRDIKSSNVLLDSNFKAKLGDFGLAKLVEGGKPARTTKQVYGTEGYVAPEYVKHRKPSKNTDTYSFGMVALEIASGQPALKEADGQKIYLSELVWKEHERKNVLALADSRLEGKFEEREMERLIVVGLACAHPDESERPSMGEALVMLKGETPLPVLKTRGEDETPLPVLKTRGEGESPLPVLKTRGEGETPLPVLKTPGCWVL